MKKSIKSIDLFGTGFQFNVLGSPTFKTVEGGLITFVCTTIIVVFTFLFGRGLFF